MTFEDTSHKPKHAFPDPVGLLMIPLLPFAMQLLANLLLNILAFMEPSSKGDFFSFPPNSDSQQLQRFIACLFRCFSLKL